jgi:hypothetical protein
MRSVVRLLLAGGVGLGLGVSIRAAVADLTPSPLPREIPELPAPGAREAGDCGESPTTTHAPADGAPERAELYAELRLALEGDPVPNERTQEEREALLQAAMSVAGATEGREIEVLDLDCSEEPCIALYAVNYDPTDRANKGKILAGQLQGALPEEVLYTYALPDGPGRQIIAVSFDAEPPDPEERWRTQLRQQRLADAEVGQ